ncbi:hypothetical protein [Bacillus sp. J37]|nr:hypothetical protein [Bacillus sp. J37]
MSVTLVRFLGLFSQSELCLFSVLLGVTSWGGVLLVVIHRLIEMVV